MIHVGADSPVLTLVTPTGDRPQAFALCELWMSRQDFTAPVQWIVVDDGQKPTQCTLDQQYVRRERAQSDPRHTLSVNLLAALPLVATDKVLFIEDDDWYGPLWLSTISQLLDFADLVGEVRTIYYHVGCRRWRRVGNTSHASLFQTGLTRAVLPTLAEVCRNDSPHVDLRLWKQWRGSKKLVDLEQPNSIGIKGLPGRPGQTSGWRAANKPTYIGDPDLSSLRSMVGAATAIYADFEVKDNTASSSPPPLVGEADASPATIQSIKPTTRVDKSRDEAPVCLPDSVTMKSSSLTFKHSGNVGDVIYSLAAVKAMGGGHLYLQTDVDAAYQVEGHPNGSVRMNRSYAEMLVPLLESQSYIKGASLYRGESIDYDLDRFRNAKFRMNRGMLSEYYLHILPEAENRLHEPSLDVEPHPEYANAIVVNRTFRYRCPGIDPGYRALASCGRRVVFLGLRDEYEDLLKRVPGIEYVSTQNLLDSAQIIRGCRLFVGNQSVCFAMAEALKVARLQELCPATPNCLPIGPAGRACAFPDELAYWIRRWG